MSIVDGIYTNNNAGHQGGVLYAADNATVSIVDGIYSNNNVGYHGGVLYAADNATLSIVDGIYSNNNAGYYGGVLYAAGNATVSVINGSYTNNNAKTSGGVLYADDAATVSIVNGIYTSNSAAETGGVLYADDDATVSIVNGTYSNNSAAEAGGVLYAGRNANVSIVTGAYTNNSAVLFGGALYSADDATVTIVGYVNFSNNNASIGAELYGIGNERFKISDTTSINPLKPTIAWMRTQCFLGETQVGGQCQVCQPSTFSLNLSALSCDECPNNAICSGGASIVPEKGFWHSTVNSFQIHQCPLEGNCLADGVCFEGHIGRVCGSCNDTFGSVAPFKCGKCLTSKVTIAVYVLAAVCAFIIVMVLAQTALKDNLAGVDSERPSDYLKFFVRHAQYLWIVGTIRVKWPTALVYLYTGVGWMYQISSAAFGGSSGVVSLDCVFASDGRWPMAIKRSLVYLATPVALLAAAILVFKVVRVAFRLLNKPFLYARSVVATVSALVVLFFFYPQVVRVGLGFFACLPLDRAGSGLYPEYAVANATHGYWV